MPSRGRHCGDGGSTMGTTPRLTSTTDACPRNGPFRSEDRARSKGPGMKKNKNRNCQKRAFNSQCRWARWKNPPTQRTGAPRQWGAHRPQPSDSDGPSGGVWTHRSRGSLVLAAPAVLWLQGVPRRRRGGPSVPPHPVWDPPRLLDEAETTAVFQKIPQSQIVTVLSSTSWNPLKM